MNQEKPDTNNIFVIKKDSLAGLFENITKAGYEMIGPKLKDGTICLDKITSLDDLPVGITDNQEPAQYRTKQSKSDTSLFSYVVGPHSPKRYVFPPRHQLWQINRVNGDQQIIAQPLPKTKLAFIGIRPCDLAALKITDRVFKGGKYTDAHYTEGRANNFILAVNCVKPGGTCFCTSVGTGPKAKGDFDLCLTEVYSEAEHFFILETGTKLGSKMISGVTTKPASKAKLKQADKLLKAAEKNMGRQLETDNLQQLIYDGANRVNWEEVGLKCLSCTNCTMVCPTCFCTSLEDTTDLRGTTAVRTRVWDSCFNEDYSYMHGGNVRSSSRARYRHWISHKLAGWVDQFGTLGCVGCGRCITWCPVGIDITEEVVSLKKRIATKKAEATAKER